MDDQTEGSLEMALRWCVAVHLQLERLAESERDVADTVYDRALLGTPDGQRRFIRLRVDAHLLLVAARNLLRAVDKLTIMGLPVDTASAMPRDLRARVKTLRDCFEHWDQRDDASVGVGIHGKAYRDFAHDYPDDDPGSYVFGGGETAIGGLNLTRLREVTTAVQAALEDAARRPALDWTLR
jgi:hypothetical protein